MAYRQNPNTIRNSEIEENMKEAALHEQKAFELELAIERDKLLKIKEANKFKTLMTSWQKDKAEFEFKLNDPRVQHDKLSEITGFEKKIKTKYESLISDFSPDNKTKFINYIDMDLSKIKLKIMNEMKFKSSKTESLKVDYTPLKTNTSYMKLENNKDIVISNSSNEKINW